VAFFLRIEGYYDLLVELVHVSALKADRFKTLNEDKKKAFEVSGDDRDARERVGHPFGNQNSIRIVSYLRKHLHDSEVTMKILILLVLTGTLSLVSWSVFADSSNRSHRLFFIERNKNNNYVQYDARLTKNNDLYASNPVTPYWVLENGGQKELTLVERKYAYGIDSQEKLEENKFRIVLVALKDRQIIIERINGSFRALVSINGRQSILEKVYIESKERLTGLPKVLYIDLFGWAKEKGLPMRERILPK
jgi:hypothetical protein